MREKIERSSLGLLAEWCPQQMILNHPVRAQAFEHFFVADSTFWIPQATGWFVTSCGHLSVMEAVDAGVPMCVSLPLHRDLRASPLRPSQDLLAILSR